MKIREIDKNVKLSDMENFMDVYEVQDQNINPYAFNLNSTVYFSGTPKSVLQVDHDLFWNTLSYKIYGTTRLWWVLMKVNDVKLDDIFQPVRAGSTIKYIEEDQLRAVLFMGVK